MFDPLPHDIFARPWPPSQAYPDFPGSAADRNPLCIESRYNASSPRRARWEASMRDVLLLTFPLIVVVYFLLFPEQLQALIVSVRGY